MLGRLVAAGCAALVMSNLSTTPPAHAAEKANTFSYPAAPKANVVEDYHGTKVADPYRPLEDPDAAETRAWVEAENKITFGFLEQIPAREPLKKRLTEAVGL